MANYTLNWLTNHLNKTDNGGGTPFFAVWASSAPHEPFDPEPKYYDYGLDDELMRAPRSPNFYSKPLNEQGNWVVSDMAGGVEPRMKDWTDWVYRRRQLSMLSVDAFVGDAVSLLEEKGVLDNTIIIFTSDHGEANPIPRFHDPATMRFHLPSLIFHLLSPRLTTNCLQVTLSRLTPPLPAPMLQVSIWGSLGSHTRRVGSSIPTCGYRFTSGGQVCCHAVQKSIFELSILSLGVSVGLSVGVAEHLINQ